MPSRGFLAEIHFILDEMILCVRDRRIFADARLSIWLVDTMQRINLRGVKLGSIPAIDPRDQLCLPTTLLPDAPRR